MTSGEYRVNQVTIVPRRSRVRCTLVLLAVELCVLLALWGVAWIMHAERWPIVSAVVAWRNAVAVIVALVSLACLVGWLLRPRRNHWLLFVLLPALVLVGLGGSGIARDGLTVDRVAEGHGRAIRLLSWNINGDLVTSDTIVRLVRDAAVDVVVLPATRAKRVKELVVALAPEGYVLAGSPGAAEAVIFSRVGYVRDRHADLGPSPFQAAVARIGDGTGELPTIVALHADHPTLSENDVWNRQISWIESLCTPTSSLLVVGDFNATVDNFGAPSLGSCRDAASARHSAAIGTWPTALPPVLGIAIDHVLTTPNLSVRSFTVLQSEDQGGARHRPILAVIGY